jgi:hypothetical protein
MGNGRTFPYQQLAVTSLGRDAGAGSPAGGWIIRCKAGRCCPVGKSAGLVESRCRRDRKVPQRVTDARCQEKLHRPGLLLTVP